MPGIAACAWCLIKAVIANGFLAILSCYRPLRPRLPQCVGSTTDTMLSDLSVSQRAHQCWGALDGWQPMTVDVILYISLPSSSPVFDFNPELPLHLTRLTAVPTDSLAHMKVKASEGPRMT